MMDDEINAVVSELLRSRFGDAGFEYSTVRSEEDFDGSSILRVTAHFNNGEVSTDRLFDALHDIRSELNLARRGAFRLSEAQISARGNDRRGPGVIRGFDHDDQAPSRPGRSNGARRTRKLRDQAKGREHRLLRGLPCIGQVLCEHFVAISWQEFRDI
jgi:hypothetical protein